MTVLETERLVLRPTHPELFDGIWVAVQASLLELERWMAWAVEPDADRTRDFTQHAATEWDSGNERHFTLFHRNEVCGQCSLDHPDPLHANYEMGYWMRSDLCGQGLMTEGAGAVVSFAFDELRVHRIELHAGTENRPSIRVAEKLGFRREGLLRGAGRGASGFHDVYVYGLLSVDRQQRNPS
jgi:ribosomal-protein-serine acetyltransferase